MHVNLGHPSKEEFVRYLSHQGANPMTLSLAANLNCETCNRDKKPTKQRVSKLPRLGQFGDELQMDIFYVNDVAQQTYPMLGMICVATWMHVAARVRSRDPDDVFWIFSTSWLRPFGLPKLILVDQDGCFQGNFEFRVTQLGIVQEAVPAEAHWKLGKIEVHDHLWRNMFHRVADSLAIFNSWQVDDAALAVSNSKNSLLKRCGRAPFGAAFGRMPRLPGECLTDESSAVIQYNVSQSEQLRQAESYRIASCMAFFEEESNQQTRRSILRKTAHRKDGDFQPGFKVAFWRTRAVKRHGYVARKAGYAIGTFCAWDPGRDGRAAGEDAWVRVNGRTLLVAREQLRSAEGWEGWTPSPQELKELKEAEDDIRYGNYSDHREEGPGATESEIPEVAVPSLGLLPVSAAPSALDGNAPASVGPSADAPPALDVPLPLAIEAPRPDKRLSPETDGRPSDPGSLSGPEVEVPVEPKRRCLEFPIQTNEAGDVEFNVPPTGWDGVDDDMHDVFVGLSQTQCLHECFLADSETNLRSAPDPDSDGEFGFFLDEDSQGVVSDDAGYQSATSNASTNVSEPPNTQDNYQSRKQEKELDREIPWRKIMEMGDSVIQKYVDALHKEEISWDKWRPAAPLDQAAADAILADPATRKRCMRSRVAYRDKNCGVGEILAKARPVLLGFQDPDLAQLNRNAPVCTRISFFILLQIVASLDWLLAAADATAAFLQGKGENANPLYMYPPRDAIVKLAKVFTAPLYQVLGNIYGRADAPFLWSQDVRTRMKKLGFVEHTLDTMCFLFYLSGRIMCMIIFHVDDALIGADRAFQLDPFWQAFEWGKRAQAPDELVFCGKQIRTLPDSSILVHMAPYVNNMHIKPVPRCTQDRSPLLRRGEEMTEFQSVGGCLQWCSGTVRLEAAAGTSLAQKGNPELSDLRQMYKIVEFLRAHPESGIRIKCIPIDDQACWIVYHDASWANAEKLKSQLGYVLIFTSLSCLTVQTDGSVLGYKSGRSQRCARSTLSAEAQSCDNAVDYSVYANHFMSEIISGNKATRTAPMFRLVAVTDCKSLFDAVHQQTPSLSEKRTLLDVQTIKEELSKENLKWVPTTVMWADGLTKFDLQLMETLRAFAMDCKVCLVEGKT